MAGNPVPSNAATSNAASSKAVPSKTAPERPIRAIVGLGNPGRKYENTRHNAGFLVVDALARRSGLQWQTRFNGEFTRLREGSLDLCLLKPGTFMNLSGHPVQAMCAFFGLAPEELLVLHDDLDLAPGRVQVKSGGGHGGHNGLRSITQQLGSNAFARVRIGIGRGQKGDPADYVLEPFSPQERAWLPQILDLAADAALAVAHKGVRVAMNEFNGLPLKAAGG